jgi:hypothetical protein
VAFNHETNNQLSEEQRLQREEALKALRRLRDIGAKLPAVDAAVIVSEGRNLVRRDSE